MSEISPFKGKSGLKRILNATQYSLDGFKAAYQNEAAFRQIVWMNIILIPTSCLLDVSRVEHALMVVVCLFALIVELFNSAIEAVVDRVSLDKHPLSKIAKDMGSAAQFVALAIIFFTWLIILLP
ncbi:diacylglycerol kinase [Acinetobacter sp. YH1901134]|uniref:diacylglycerol kinase n=1 Tax=Acinetobacter sp. YH1901134 TaxID=2601199 RepID=UPI0015D1641D|nr:diacylglycerol kinase [Acinetobacter sp. YH1901134]